MSCTKTYTINAPSQATDMPLDQAVFGTSTVAGGSFIWAVRGGYIYKFTSSGTLVTSKRYTNGPSFGEASIAYDAVGDMLYAAFWNEGMNIGTGYPTNDAKGIWSINPSTLASSFTDINPIITAGLLFGPLAANQTFSGPHQIICVAGKLLGTASWMSISSPRLITFRLNIPALTLDARNQQGSSRDSWYDVCWDTNLSTMWFTGSEFDGLISDDFVGGDPSTVSLGTAEGPVGICQTSASPFWLYATTRSKTLVKFQSLDSGSFSLFDMSSGYPAIATCKPYRCRFNTADGLIYMPDPVTNSVIIWNPATDAVSEIKTGFDTPFDVVFTATKKFAVQQGSIGLKEIT
jgi:hypothetical protein